MESNISNSLKRKGSVDETFDFPMLPYVCQRRFAEICDPQTLKCFASINSATKKLAKRCHFIKKVEIVYRGNSLLKCKYSVFCFCKKRKEFCKGIINDEKHFIQQILSKVDFQKSFLPLNKETFEIIFKGEKSVYLMIFAGDSKYYIFKRYKRSRHKFCCQKCFKLNHRVSAKLITNHLGEEYLQFDKNVHVCQPLLLSNYMNSIAMANVQKYIIFQATETLITILLNKYF